MDIKLNTGICPVIDVGMYTTFLSPEHMCSEDINWNEVNFNYKKYNEMTINVAETWLNKNVLLLWEEILKCKITLNEFQFWSPKEYNFQNDQMDFTLSIDEKNIIKYLSELIKKDAFLKWAEDNWKSYDGFISFMPHRYDQMKEALDPKHGNFDRLVAMTLTFMLIGKEKDLMEDWFYFATDNIHAEECIEDE